MPPRLVTETDVVLYCDFHGHSRKNNVFMYGCNTPGDAALKLRERVFPLMMSKNASNKVNWLTHASKKTKTQWIGQQACTAVATCSMPLSFLVLLQELQVPGAEEQRGNRTHHHVETWHQKQLHHGGQFRRLHSR